MTAALTTTEQKPQSALVPSGEFSAFGNITHFENAQRMAKALSSSSMVPDRYRGDQNLGSCMIALEISNRIGMNVLAVMQNLYDVHGKPAWSSQFLIACVNACKKFTPIRYKMTGEKGQDSYGCIAWAMDKTGERLESPEITVAIAKAEGWYQKNGSKWKTMPELMLRYRTATLFARLFAPELTMGIQTDDEVIDIVEVAPVVTDTAPKLPEFGAPSKKKEKPAEIVAEVVAEPKPKSKPAPVVAAQESPAPETTDVPAGNPPTALEALEAAMQKADVVPAQVLGFYNGGNLRQKDAPEATQLSDLPAPVRTGITKALNDGNAKILAALRAIEPV